MLDDQQIKSYRQTLGSFVTGVTIITTVDDAGNPKGLTANSFTSVSLSPPIVLVCVAKTATSYPAFKACAAFGVNILANEQRALSNKFASKTQDKFDDVDWYRGHGGIPVIEGNISALQCSTLNCTDCGDHIILIGKVEAFIRSEDREPLVYVRGGYAQLRAPGSAEQMPHLKVKVGAILEADDTILLIRERDGQYALPCRSRLGPLSDAGSLLGWLDTQGAGPSIVCIFSVFEHREDPSEVLSVYYYGKAQMPATGGELTAVSIHDLSPQLLSNSNERYMIERFLEERKHGRMGIYYGSPPQVRIFADP